MQGSACLADQQLESRNGDNRPSNAIPDVIFCGGQRVDQGGQGSDWFRGNRFASLTAHLAISLSYAQVIRIEELEARNLEI